MYAPREKQNKAAVQSSIRGLRPANRQSNPVPADLQNINENQSRQKTAQATPAVARSSPRGGGNGFRHNFADLPVFPVFPRPVRGLQTKLTVNIPGDAHEQEADRVAEQVMRMVEPAGESSVNPMSKVAATGAGLQRACACGGTCDDCKKKSHDEQHAKIQMKAAGPVNA